MPSLNAKSLLEDTKVNISCAINESQTVQQQRQQHQQHQQQQLDHQLQHTAAQMGTKRNRVLTRQPRVKRDSDSLSSTQISPEPTTGSSLDFEQLTPTQTLYTSAVHGLHHMSTHHHLGHHLLTVPPRIERHSSEPAPSLSPSSPHLLSVPQTTPYLVKQHSDPLLPSQHSAHLSSNTSGNGNLTNPFAPLHRQYSHPLTGSTSAYLAQSASLQHSHHISLPESIYETASPPPAGSSQYIVPQTNLQQQSHSSSTSNNNSNTTTSTSLTSPTKSISLPQFTTTYMGCERSTSVQAATSPPIPRVPIVHLSERSASEDNTPAVCQVNHPTTASVTSITSGSKFRSTKSASSVMLSERSSSSGGGGGGGSVSSQLGSFEHLPTLRVRNEELQRSVSSPQVSKIILAIILKFFIQDLICFL